MQTMPSLTIGIGIPNYVSFTMTTFINTLRQTLREAEIKSKPQRWRSTSFMSYIFGTGTGILVTWPQAHEEPVHMPIQFPVWQHHCLNIGLIWHPIDQGLIWIPGCQDAFPFGKSYKWPRFVRLVLNCMTTKYSLYHITPLVYLVR